MSEKTGVQQRCLWPVSRSRVDTSRLQSFAVLQNYHSLRCLCQPVRAAVTVSNYWGLFLIHLFFKSASFAHACREGSSYWRRAGKSDAKPPERREREGGRVVCKERAKRRNEWGNKWITDGMWVSASRKISLWLPRQREVRVGSAPDITNYVRVRARLWDYWYAKEKLGLCEHL